MARRGGFGVKGVRLDLSGLKAIEKESRRRTITTKAVKAGAKIVQRAAKASAPKRKKSGALRSSIGVKAVKGKKGKTIAYAVIGPRKSKVKLLQRGRKQIRVIPRFYAHLVEKGTAAHSLGDGRQHPGTAARPFLRPALDSTRSAAGAEAARVLAAEIEKEIAKAAGKVK